MTPGAEVSEPISRTALCPCGSGRRYKHCCGAATAPAAPIEAAPAAAGDAFAAALGLHQAGDIEAAERIYRAILETQPARADVLHYLGVCRHQRGDFEAAERHIRAALAHNDREPMACNNLGLVCKAQNRFDEALACFDQALAQDPANAVACNNRGLVLHERDRLDDAVRDFTQATLLQGDFAEAFSNLANTLVAQKRFAEALANADKATALNPRLATAHAIRGSALRKLERYQEALASWERVLALDPGFAKVHAERGAVLQLLKRYEEAAASLGRAVALEPEIPYLLGDALFCRKQCCDWTGFEAACAAIFAAIDRGERAIGPFRLMELPATLAQLQRCTRIFVADTCPTNPSPTWRGERYAHARIRIGYVSADFRDHPVAQLIAGLIESHDRTIFEVIGIYIGPPVEDVWHARLQRAFDRFLDVRAMSDEEIAASIRALEIDIAIDLMGYTAYARPRVFALRAAPVQVGYLGFPGTMGAAHIDYLIADATVVPPGHRRYFDEKIACVPHSYLVNDATKRISDTTMSRAELGLPDDAFVFCCFNRAGKITPDVFDVWMRLLRTVGDSVLWLMGAPPAAERNLRGEAQRRGVAPERLLFAARLPLADHLARHRRADLFLDTFHHNAHTTASDALWAGLPVLTCRGEMFASRVAASLLNAVGLPELVTRTPGEYEALALLLATQPERLAALRRKLAVNRTTQPLFDTALSTRHFEAVYRRMHERHQAGLPPDDFVVDA